MVVSKNSTVLPDVLAPNDRGGCDRVGTVFCCVFRDDCNLMEDAAEDWKTTIVTTTTIEKAHHDLWPKRLARLKIFTDDYSREHERGFKTYFT